MCYNLFVKKSVLATTSLCALLCASLCIQGTAVFADAQNEGYDVYPSEFKKTVQFENLRDFAIGEDKCYFLDEETVYAYGNGAYGQTDEAVDFTAKETGEFYVKGYLYSLDGELIIYNTTAGEQRLEGFSNLKNYGDTAYAVKENVLYRFNGATPVECKLEYFDYSAVNYINIGDTADKLKNADGNAPVFVRLSQGAFMTKIKDINDLSGEYFKTDETVNAEAKTVLLLCKTGKDDGISIVMINETLNGKAGGACYMLRTDDTREIARNSVEQKDYLATVTIAEGFIYSSPYVCGATQVAKIASGDKVEIQGFITHEQNEEVLRDFYLVKLEDGTKGYVPQEYVSMFSYIEKDPEATKDPDYSEDDMIKPVVLILIVIALVFLAVGYLVYVGTSGKKKQKNNNDDKKDKIK